MRTFLLTVAALAAVATAQTHSECDPTKKDGCKPNPAIPANFESKFTAGESALQGWKTTAGALTYGADGAHFTINKQGEAPTIQSDGFLHFGYVEVKAKAAPGQGIVSSIVLQSDNLDEVDWEFLGSNDAQVQTNYFGKGDTTTYDRMIPYNTAANQQTVHTYAVNWTAESLTWIIDDVPVRTLNYADAKGGSRYPQTPVNVRIGIWAGGDPTNEPGVIEWAGGKTDYSKVPFTMTVESVKIINYSPGCSYTWSKTATGDLPDGSYKNIKVSTDGCTVPTEGVFAPTATPTATKTGAAPLGDNTASGAVSTETSTAATGTTDVTTAKTTSGDVTPTDSADSTSTASDASETSPSSEQPDDSETATTPAESASSPDPTGSDNTTASPTDTEGSGQEQETSTPTLSTTADQQSATASASAPPQFTGAAASNGAAFGALFGALLVAVAAA